MNIDFEFSFDTLMHKRSNILPTNLAMQHLISTPPREGVYM